MNVAHALSKNTCGAGPHPAYRATGVGRPERPPQAEGLPHGMCGVPSFFRPILARRAGMGTLLRAASPLMTHGFL
jgi:hypothetical protein